jgi:hypothetical protein
MWDQELPDPIFLVNWSWDGLNLLLPLEFDTSVFVRVEGFTLQGATLIEPSDGMETVIHNQFRAFIHNRNGYAFR